ASLRDLAVSAFRFIPKKSFASLRDLCGSAVNPEGCSPPVSFAIPPESGYSFRRNERTSTQNHRLPENLLRLERRRPRHHAEIRSAVRGEGHHQEPGVPLGDGAAQRPAAFPVRGDRWPHAAGHQRRGSRKMAFGKRLPRKE